MDSIEIRNLRFTYPASSTPVLKDISLTIEKGDFLAIVGNNGSGKSTFCKVLNGLIPHYIDGDFSGTVVVEGQDTLKSSVGELATKVGYVYQDFENQIVRPTVLDDASYACLNNAFEDYLEKGKEALAKCGLDGHEDDFIWQLSGGQTHLLALAGTLALEPEILILDEPIAQLDPHHADIIYGILKTLNERYGKTIIVIEHHSEYIAKYCKHVMLMKHGSFAWKKKTEDALQEVEELMQSNIFPPQVTLAAYRLKKEKGYTFDRLPVKMEEVKDTFHGFTFHKEEAGKKEAGETIISCKDVSLSYHSLKGEDHVVFDKLNLDIHKGEHIALIGTNGAGKSSLMKLLVRLIKDYSGEILLEGRDIRKEGYRDIASKISLVYQNPEQMFIRDSIANDIAFALEARGMKNAKERTDELLHYFDLEGLRDRDGRLLSGGQMRRATLAIGTALNPEVLLLDEPTANLDMATRKEIIRTLDEMRNVIHTAVIATHDMQLVAEWADRIIVLHDGRVIADGDRDMVFNNPSVIEEAGIRPPEIFTAGKMLDEHASLYTIDGFMECFKEV